MAIITNIENSIIQLGAGEFQKFCDTFLSMKDQYGTILGLGMKSGTLKTTIGNPDTYFRNKNGKYVFVAYTCQQSGIFDKLKNDIEKCLDPEKTKLPIEEIEEIICCHTSSNLLAGDDLKLHKMCEEKGVKLTLFGVDEIAQQVYRHYPKIAKDFFNISIDTNQIMQIDDFVALYDSNEMAAPLSTSFHGRKEELLNVLELIKTKKVTIIHGPAGTGKTRLVIEAIRRYSEENNVTLLCVKNNNQPLYEDLVSKIDRPGDYLFFVDDANELSGLSHILHYILRVNEGYHVKVVLTVRDYAKEAVIRTVNEITKPGMLLLSPFTENDIRDFLSINMGITTTIYVDQIIKISEGNPRIAYMAGKLALEKQNLSSIHDVSQVYEQYYANIVDLKIGSNRDLCLTAGILSLVNAVLLDKMDCLSELLKVGNISEQSFKDCIFLLSQMEVVEIHKDQVAAISDQCLSNYMLYYTFFKTKLIHFSDVLYIGFKHFKKGVIKSLNTLLNLFASESLRDYISDEVRVVWEKYECQKEQCFNDFAVTFHVFQPEEAFLIASDGIQNLPSEEFVDGYVDFEKSTMINSADQNILGMFSGYDNSKYLKTAMELLLEYVSKSAEKAVNGYQFIKNTYCVDQNSYLYHFYPEQTVCEAFKSFVGDNLAVYKFMLAVVKEYLQFQFRPTEMWRGNTFRIYHLELRNNDDVKKYRESCWEVIIRLLSIPDLRVDIEEFLKKYAISLRGVNDESIAVDDKRYVESIMAIIQINDFRKALIRRDLYYGWRKLGITHKEEISDFETKEWELLTVLEDDFLYSDQEYEKYEKQRVANIEEYADRIDKDEFPVLLDMAIYIIDNSKFRDSRDKRYSIVQGIEIIITKLCADPEMPQFIFDAVLDRADELEINPRVFLRELFKTMPAETILSKIKKKSFKSSNRWNFAFFDIIPEELVDESIYKHLFAFLEDDSDKDIQQSPYRSLRFLDKFLPFDDKVYINASKIIMKKTEYSKFIAEMYFSLLFHDNCYNPEEVTKLFNSDMKLLQAIYFFMLENGHLETNY